MDLEECQEEMSLLSWETETLELGVIPGNTGWEHVMGVYMALETGMTVANGFCSVHKKRTCMWHYCWPS